MSKGLDTTQNTAPHATALLSAGYSFVCRYYSHSLWKNLAPSEAVSLSKAGLSIVAVWESAGDHASFFSTAQGVKDGADAHRFARSIGQPLATPIYFAVDCDVPGVGAVEHYFAGVRQSLGANTYHVGVYGSGDVCRHLKGIGYASHTWLAQAMGWSGSRTYGDWNIRQLPSKTILGMNCDEDEASPKGGGGWQVK